MKSLHMITWILLIIGGLNWGLEGALNWGVGSFLPSSIEMIVYILVGLSAVFEIVTHKSSCKHCEKEPAAVTPVQ
jgi:uncharacterized membrane protein YuzA (DUF378 family)